MINSFKTWLEIIKDLKQISGAESVTVSPTYRTDFKTTYMVVFHLWHGKSPITDDVSSIKHLYILAFDIGLRGGLSVAVDERELGGEA